MEAKPPNHFQMRSSVAKGFGGTDKMGGSPCLASYEEDRMEMREAYKEQDKEGKRSVHVRKNVLQQPRPQGDGKFNRRVEDVLGELAR